MRLAAHPAPGLTGSARLPGDKSISHRAALFGALAEGTSRAEGFLRAGVTNVMLDSLAAAGVAARFEDETLVIEGAGRHGLSAAGMPLYCGNSATTFRLLAGAIAGRPSWFETAPQEFTLDASAQLRRRPMGRVMEPLRAMGAAIRPLDQPDCPPLAILPAALHGVSYRMPVASAQVKSAILLAGLSAAGETTVEEPAPSRDHTERFLRHLGVQVDASGNRVTVHSIPKPLPAFHIAVPGDFSSAAFLIAAATILRGSDILIRGVGLNPRRTGLLAVLARMGANIAILNQMESAGEPAGDLRVRSANLQAALVEGGEVVDMIDEFPVFAVAAAFAEGTTVVRQAEELRHKESDRIAALAAELRSIGVSVDETGDGFAIHGTGSITGGKGFSHGDHRLAMALTVAGLASRHGVQVEGAECISESFPEFTGILNSLGAGL